VQAHCKTKREREPPNICLPFLYDRFRWLPSRLRQLLDEAGVEDTERGGGPRVR